MPADKSQAAGDRPLPESIDATLALLAQGDRKRPFTVRPGRHQRVRPHGTAGHLYYRVTVDLRTGRRLSASPELAERR